MAKIGTDEADFSGLLEDFDTFIPDQEPRLVQESKASQSEIDEQEADFSGLLPTKKSKKPPSPTTKSSPLPSSVGIRSKYGHRKDPITGARAFHDGIDFDTPLNTPLKPFGHGTIVFAGSRGGGYGKAIGIDYGNGVIIYLNHLNETKVEPGDRVTPEAIIGLSGNTGRSTGPHTHVQAMRDGKSINPLEVLQQQGEGFSFVLKGLQEDSEIISTNPDKDADFSGLMEEEDGIEADFSGLGQESEVEPVLDNTEVKVLDFEPLTVEDRIAQDNRPILAKAAGSIAAATKIQIKPRIKNPNAPGKPISFIFNKPPTFREITEGIINHKGLAEINKRFTNEPDIKKRGVKSIIDLSVSPEEYDKPAYSAIGLKVRKLPTGQYEATVENGIPSGIVDIVNAYARGGLEAYNSKKDELLNQSRLYKEDIALQQEQQKNIINRHPWLAVLDAALGNRHNVAGTYEAIQAGAQDVALAEIQFYHNLSMLPQALWTGSKYGYYSEEYEDLIRKDLSVNLDISQAQQNIQEQTPTNTLQQKVVRSGTSAIGSLARYGMAARVGGPAGMLTMAYVENLHRGPRDAALAALPFAIMGGGQTGLEKFIASPGASFSGLFRKRLEANDEFITSISSRYPFDPTKVGNKVYMLSDDAGIPVKTLDFASISPFQRQLIMRGQNALTNVASSAIVHPDFNLQEGVSQFVIGLGLPIGKGGRPETGAFRRPSIITGDAYTLPDGATLLIAPVDLQSGLISGRVPEAGIIARQMPLYEESIPRGFLPAIAESRAARPIDSRIEGAAPIGNTTSLISRREGIIINRGAETSTGKGLGFETGHKFGTLGVDATTKQKVLAELEIGVRKSVLLDIDTAALNLIDLRRALEQGTYKSIEKLGVFQRAKEDAQRAQDLQAAIKVLDDAIPKETQKFFEENEALIREAIKTNYESRIQKEEFIKGHKIVRKQNPTIEDVRQFDAKSRTANKDTWAQRTRRDLVSIEESGRQGLEANKKNKGTFNAGIDPSDLTYLVQIGIGKLGQKGLNATEFAREMIAEFGEDIRGYLGEIYNRAVDVSSPEDIQRVQRGLELFGDIGSKNRYFTQEKQIRIREDLFKVPKTRQLNEGFTASSEWLAANTSRLVQIVGFHVEDAYRRQVEPRLDEILSKLRGELGDWVDRVEGSKWAEIFDSAIKYYQSNNADPFFSGLKQNVLEKFPDGNIRAETAKNILERLGTREELEWTTGLRDFVDSRIREGKKISKRELLDVIGEGQVRVEEVVLGERFNTLPSNMKVIESDKNIRFNFKYEVRDDKNNLIGAGDTVEKATQDALNELNGATKATRYDLKTYTAERLELQGGENPREVLLQIPLKKNEISLDEWLDANPMTRELYDRGSQIEREFLEAQYNRDKSIIGDRAEPYSTPHWTPHENIVAHFRANERTTIDGARVFHSEEFQSDWNQQGRKEGYRQTSEFPFEVFTRRSETVVAKFKTEQEARDYIAKDLDDLGYARLNYIDIRTETEGAVPQNPFMQNNWKELSFKRFLRMAIESNADGVTWTTARQQQERGGKLYEGKKITWLKYDDGLYSIKLGEVAIPEGQHININRVRELTNDKIANEIINSKYQYDSIFLDKAINISKGYSDYDTYFVNLAKKIGKRFGARYEMREIETGRQAIKEREVSSDEFFETLDSGIAIEPKIEKVHFLEITPAMRNSILKEGLPTYGLPTQEPLKASAPTGIRNKIITRDAFDLAKNEIVLTIQPEADSNGTIFNSGLNPDAFVDQLKLLYKGFTDITAFSDDLIRKYGDKIKPHIEPLWNYLQNSAKTFHQDERGIFNFGKKVIDTTELKIFESNEPSRTRKLSYIIHRGVALAQTYEPVGRIYDTMRGLQRTSNAYGTTILGQLTKAVKGLEGDIDQRTAKAIFARNLEGNNDATGAADSEVITRFGLNAEQTEAYYHVRGSVANVLNLRRDQLLYKEHQVVSKLNDDLAGEIPGTKEHDAILEKILDADKRIQNIQSYYADLKDSGYISLQRLGRYRAEAQDTAFPVGDDRRFLVDYVDTPEEAQARINEWRGKYSLIDSRILDAHKPNDFREIARNLTPHEFEELVAGAKVNPKSEDVESLRAEVYEKYPTMGYQLKRKFYRGYRETNEFMLKSIAHQANVYESSYYNNIGREEGLKALQETGLETSDRELYNVMRQYIEDETSTSRYNWFDKAAFKARKFTYLMQLAFQAKQFVLNALVQPVTQNYNYLARVENPNNGKRLTGTQAEKMFIGGTRLAIKTAKDNLGMKVVRDARYNEFKSVYDRLKLEKVIEPEFTKSLLELEAETPIEIKSTTRFGKKLLQPKRHEHWAGVFMRKGELATRTQMAASMFLAGKRFGLAGEPLIDFIVRGIDATQTNPTRGENPYAIRQFGEVGKLFYQFGSFRHMWFENLVLNAKSDWKHRSPASIARTLGPLAIVAGIKGLPLAGAAFTIYALATGRNPDEEIKRWTKKIADNNYLENAVLNGATGSSSFSRSAGIQVPLVDTLGEQLTQDRVVDRVFSDNIPFVLTMKQLAEGFSMLISGIHSGKQDEILRGIEEAAPIPRQGKDLIKAFGRYPREGYKTKSGTRIIPPSQITLSDQFGQVLGLTPNQVNEEFEKRKYKKLRRSKIGRSARKLVRKVL